MVASKQELRDEIIVLTKRIEELQKEKWGPDVPLATELCHKMLKATVGKYCNLTFYRFDDAGFWFSYNVYENNQYVRHTTCIRHSEVGGESVKRNQNIVQCIAVEISSLKISDFDIQHVNTILRRYGAKI